MARAAQAEDRWRRYREAAQRHQGLAERSRLEQRLDRLLGRGRWPGRALQIARSGVWRPRLSQSLGFGGGPTAGLLRYARAGADPLIRPKALFDQAWYLEKNPELIGGRWAPLAHYLIVGDPHGRSPHPLFDVRDYRSRHAVKIAASRQSALQHFLFAGAQDGFDPHPLFDVRYYVGRCEELATTGENPLVHYLRQGWREGLDPHPLFAGDWYVAENPVAAESGSAPLLHYLVSGAAEGRDPHPLFDSAWYVARRRDIAGSGLDPLSHFVRVGARQRSSPGPHFDSTYYLEQHSELAESGINPLIHYVTEGAFSGAWPAADFDEASYFAGHPEAADCEWSGLEHWLRTRGARPAATGDSPGRWVSAEALFEQLRANSRTRDAAAFNLPAYQTLSAERLEWPTDSKTIAPPMPDHGGVEFIVAATPAEANLGAASATGEVLYFSTQAMTGTFAPLVRALEASGVGMATPLIVGHTGETLAAGARISPDGGLIARSAPTGIQTDSPGWGAAIRRTDFLDAGGFDNRYLTLPTALTDLALRLRARGLAAAYVADAIAQTEHLDPHAPADAQTLLERWGEEIEALNEVRVIALYRPDLAGGAIWTKVTQALPNYRGHYQPHLPADLGYYSAKDPSLYQRQAELARRYGVAGFCHVFHPEAPPEFLVRADAPAMPFCLRLEGESVSPAIAPALAPYLCAPLALKAGGAPVLLAATSDDYGPDRIFELRAALKSVGVERVILIHFSDFAMPAPSHPLSVGYDGTINFAWAAEVAAIQLPGPRVNRRLRGTLRDYRTLAQKAVTVLTPEQLPGLAAGFDDTPLAQDDASTYHHASPGAFQVWLEAAMARVRNLQAGDHKLAFVHAWNGWAEGACLEPDIRFGHGWLEAIRNAADADLLEQP